jgi:hypothetical protein
VDTSAWLAINGGEMLMVMTLRVSSNPIITAGYIKMGMIYLLPAVG